MTDPLSNFESLMSEMQSSIVRLHAASIVSATYSQQLGENPSTATLGLAIKAWRNVSDEMFETGAKIRRMCDTIEPEIEKMDEEGEP